MAISTNQHVAMDCFVFSTDRDSNRLNSFAQFRASDSESLFVKSARLATCVLEDARQASPMNSRR
jgi:hypothetical protein